MPRILGTTQLNVLSVMISGVSVISLDKALEVVHVTASVGENVEIKCDVSGSPPMPIVWRRYGVDLSTLNQDDQIRVFTDGTLFLNKIQLLHAGNYTCHAERNQEVVQTHILSVQSKLPLIIRIEKRLRSRVQLVHSS